MTPFNEIREGDLIAEVSFTKVRQKKTDSIYVESVDKKNHNYWVQGKELVETVISADYFNETIKAPLTKVAEILVVAFNQPFTVTFTKKEGEERTLRGRLVSSEHLLGRVMVEDLDIEGHRLRQVDLRTLKQLIIGGKKYVVK